MIAAHDALARLQEGNRRFLAGRHDHERITGAARRSALVSGQAPSAVVLGCSDSRVPAEIVFDQGVGDLFVVRVAGNIVAPSQVSSVEYAVERLAARLVVVLGHTQCGAVRATLGELRRPVADRSPSLHAVVDHIRPSVEALLEAGGDPEEVLQRAVRSNIRASVQCLRHASPLLERLSTQGELLVVGAEYALETGAVAFFDVPSDPGWARAEAGTSAAYNR